MKKDSRFVKLTSEGGITVANEIWVDRETGVVTFNKPIRLGDVVTAGFLFDVEVRFEDDSVFDGILKNWNVAGYSDIPLVEVRHCTDDD